MEQILAVSKTTKNVLTITDPNDFIFHSNYNTFKILAQGTNTGLVVDGDPKTFTIAHNLGYAPNFYAFCKFPDGKVTLAGPLSFPYDRDTRQFFLGPSFDPQVDSTNLSFVFTRPGSNYTVSIRWYIFEVVL